MLEIIILCNEHAHVIFISVIMALLFRANSILFASLVTNLIPIFTVLGILAWLGISIRPPTAMTFAVALGIAVDDSLHFLLRYRRELRQGLSRVDAIKATITLAPRVASNANRLLLLLPLLLPLLL